MKSTCQFPALTRGAVSPHSWTMTVLASLATQIRLRGIAVEEDPPTDLIGTSQFKILQDRFRQWWSVGYVPKRMM
jgi:hypothetical protein